jgi:putative transposase
MAIVHLVWIPKRRKKVLIGDVKTRLAAIIGDVAKEKGWIVRALEIAPDHVHLFVDFDETTPIKDVAKAFKGRSSHDLRKEFPHLLKLPSLWTRSYFYCTAGNVSAETIKGYINDPHHSK